MIVSIPTCRFSTSYAVSYCLTIESKALVNRRICLTAIFVNVCYITRYGLSNVLSSRIVS